MQQESSYRETLTGFNTLRACELCYMMEMMPGPEMLYVAPKDWS